VENDPPSATGGKSRDFAAGMTHRTSLLIGLSRGLPVPAGRVSAPLPTDIHPFHRRS
jgi:hypothetical protein